MNFSDLLYSLEDLKTFKNNFIIELTKAKDGNNSSLEWLKHYLPEQAILSKDERFQSISFGGTNWVSAECSVQKNSIHLKNIKRGKLPIFQDKKHFLEFIIKIIDFNLKHLSFAFAYPLKPLFRDGLQDGVLIKATKGNRFHGLIDEMVGRQIEEYLKEKVGMYIRVAVANDTVCNCLSGLNEFKMQTLASLVVGTGSNIAFFEDNSIINLESGNLDKIFLTESGKFVDLNSINSGHHLFEKEVSGAYLYLHYNYLVSKYNLKYNQLSSSLEMNKAFKNNLKIDIDISRMLIERSASLIATQVAALYEFRKQKRLNIITEGSIFWEVDGYKEFVKKYLNLLNIPEDLINFVKIENSSLLGAGWLLCKR